MPKSISLHRAGPLYLIRRGEYYHIHGTHDGKRIRVATNTDDIRLAQQALDDMHHQVCSGWRSSATDIDVQWKLIAKATCARHRVHSKARGIPFAIEANDVYHLMQEASFCCAVSGIPFSRKNEFQGSPDPWAPSIDRIENRHGYQKDNIRVVSLAANLAMNRWGYDVLLRLSKAVVRNAQAPIREISSELTQNLTKDEEGDHQAIELL